MAKKAFRGDDSETSLAKKDFSGDEGRGRFAKGLTKAQVAKGLFSGEVIIHFEIVTAEALFGHASSLPRPYLASALPNPSPPAHFLTIPAILALSGRRRRQPYTTRRCAYCPLMAKRADRGRQIENRRYAG